ncbi:MAG TPA: hypothetical protein VNZ85_02875 [Caulobacter sp.]|nr:hypothetical protein [Caulobacter sp.]
MRKFVLGVLAALPFLLASGQANALTRTGKITGVFLSTQANLPFRISLDNSPSECAAGILYVDFGNANYQAYVSALLLAYSQGKQVQIYYSPAQAVPGQPLPACVIQEFGVF